MKRSLLVALVLGFVVGAALVLRRRGAE